MAIKGSLREASMPDVLQLLAMGGKTGCLSITNRREFGYVFFQDGRICFASLVNRGDRIGELFVKHGLITPAQLATALDEQSRHPTQRVGELLIEAGAITREHLEHYIRVQIEEAVYHLFTWTDGSFFFDPDQRPADGEMLVSIHPENVLLEGARRVDEWSLIEKKIPSLDLIFALDRSRTAPDGLVLGDEQRRLLPLLDGGHSVEEIRDTLGLGEFEVGKALFGLIQAGLVVEVGRRAPSTGEPTPPSRIDEHCNLGIAFFRTGMHEEALREFRRVLELDADHVRARMMTAAAAIRSGDVREAMVQLRGVLERNGPSPAALATLGLALETAGRTENALAASDEAARIDPTHLPALLSRAIQLLKLHRLPDAAEAFARYRQAAGTSTRPPSVYFAFAVLAEAAAGRLNRAIEIGEEGLALHPRCAPLLLHLGAARERAGDVEGAETLYRRSCEEDPSLPQAHKALGDALYRRGAFAEAARAFDDALQLAPALGDDVYFKLGNIAYKRGDRAEAVRMWRRALELNPRNEVVRTNLEVVESVLAETASPRSADVLAGAGV